jgi:hypothetical protein
MMRLEREICEKWSACIGERSRKAVRDWAMDSSGITKKQFEELLTRNGLDPAVRRKKDKATTPTEAARKCEITTIITENIRPDPVEGLQAFLDQMIREREMAAAEFKKWQIKFEQTNEAIKGLSATIKALKRIGDADVNVQQETWQQVQVEEDDDI